MSAFSFFIRTLLFDGNVAVENLMPFEEPDVAIASQTLREFEALYREDLPAGMPEFDVQAALWSAQAFFRACQFAMFREIDAVTMQREFDALKQPTDSTASHYSVHLIFRFLPDLVRLTKSISKEDPLNVKVQQWAEDWPLSSIGLRNVASPKLDKILSHQSLMKMYIDRIIEKDAFENISSAKLRDQICIALGAHHPRTDELLKKDFDHQATITDTGQTAGGHNNAN